jgi:glutamate formiminotransferase/formiminotetrahydrofolate cyclodeaminase
MGLEELSPFRPEERILEYVLRARAGKRLVDLTLRGFVEATAAETPAPGGGSVAAAVGALGAALGTMVANLSAHKRGWDARWEEFSAWAEKGKACHDELLRLVDEDTLAFDAVLAAFRLPKATDAEKQQRKAAIDAATRRAIEVPLRVLEVAVRAMDVVEAAAREGLASSASDAGVGALCARTAALGAFLNVRTNAKGLGDRKAAEAYVARATKLRDEAALREEAILRIVESR